MNTRRRYLNGVATNHLLRVLPVDWFLALTSNVTRLLFSAVLLYALALGFVTPAQAWLGFSFALVTTDNIKYGTSTAMALTWTALASSATAGRQCTLIDNSSNLFDDVLVTVTLATNASAPSGDKACYLWFMGTEDGTNYDHDDAAPGATDAAYTINTASNLRGPVAISMPTASKTYVRTVTLSSLFGGLVPRGWAFVATNQTGNALIASATNTQPTYTGITYTNT